MVARATRLTDRSGPSSVRDYLGYLDFDLADVLLPFFVLPAITTGENSKGPGSLRLKSVSADMNGGFSFPPPPPPPPKSGSDSISPGATYASQNRGGRSRGRGRGEARGGVRGRGGQAQARQHHSHHNHQRANFSHAQQGSSQYGGLPAGTYINPDFTSRPNLTPSVDQASKSARNNDALPAEFPPRTHAGHKRKLDALRPPQEERTKPSPQTAPSIPRFGAPVLSQGAVHSLPQKPQVQARSTSNGLGLTPGDADPEYSSSEDEAEDKEVDEEAMYAELGTKLAFEHNGVVLSLNSEADLAAWREERKKKWPTRTRVTEKDAEKRRIGQKRNRLLASASLLESADASRGLRLGRLSSSDGHSGHKDRPTAGDMPAGPKKDSREPTSERERTQRELMKQAAQLDQLRKKLAASEAALARLKESQESEHFVTSEETLAKYGSDVAANDDDLDQNDGASSDTSSILSESSVLSSDSSNDSDSDDGPPEETSTKVPMPTTDATVAPRCKYFAASGYCRDGDVCRFRHELMPGVKPATNPLPATQRRKKRDEPDLDYSATAKKKTIYQRLLEQQHEEEDRLALQVIKYLGKAEFFAAKGQGDEVA